MAEISELIERVFQDLGMEDTDATFKIESRYEIGFQKRLYKLTAMQSYREWGITTHDIYKLDECYEKLVEKIKENVGEADGREG